VKQGFLVGQFDDAAEIHDGDVAAEVLDHARLCEMKRLGRGRNSRCRSIIQVEDLRLDRDVERGDGSSAMMSFGESASARAMPIPLALAARELVRIVRHLRLAQGRRARNSAATRAVRSLPRAMPCTRSGSPTMSPTDMRGSSEENGSWKMICICLRRAQLDLARRV